MPSAASLRRRAPLALASLLPLVAHCAQGPTRFDPGSGAADTGPAVDAGSRVDVPVHDDLAPIVDVGSSDRTTVRTTRDLFVGGAAPNSAMRFNGPAATEATRAPSIVYPDDGTIIPPNLPSFEIHFLPGAGNDLFEVTFTGDVGVARFFTPCTRLNEGCALSLTTEHLRNIVWAAQGSSNVSIAIRGVSSATPNGSVASSAARRSLGLTQSELRGGVYWWASASSSIVRYEFGREGATPEVFLRGGLFDCVGCHALSRDGRRIAPGRGIPGPAVTGVLDVSNRAMIGDAFGSNFGTFSPDNRFYLSSNGMAMVLLDAATGRSAPGLEANFAGSMPDWSPNGNVVVFSRPRTALPLPLGSPGHDGPADLFLMPWRGTTFGPPARFVEATSGENNYYPSFSPDGQWVVFNRAHGGSFNNPAAQLYAVRADGRGAPIRLARADGEGALRNSWPKWTPFVERYVGELAEPLMWITFSSQRNYGLRSRAGTSQLWMAAFRPNGNGNDPSAPAFWVPFQNLAEGNHIAQWVEEVRRQDCGDAGACAMGETCIRGRCVGAPP